MNGTNEIACNERPSPPSDRALNSKSGPVEVNVIFTDRDATGQALRAAIKLAANLNACIRLRAVIAVPMRLPLDHPQISVPFVEKVLQSLVSDLNSEGVDVTAHLYLSRDRFETLQEILPADALVVVAGRRRPWPLAESRLIKRLRSKGHRVLFVPVAKEKVMSEMASSDTRAFVLETNLTAASFLAANSNELRIHRRSAVQAAKQA